MKVQLTRSDIIEHNAIADLSRRLVTRPASTFIINLEGFGLLIVDRAAVPQEGSVMLMSTDNGFKLQRATKHGVPSQDMWGVVTWHIRRP